MASSEPSSPVPVKNIPMWATSVPGQPGAGYEAAAPLTRPKVYAGAAAAPPASIAPSPPLAWQQQQPVDRQLRNEQDMSVMVNSSANPWNRRTADVNSLAMQMNSVGLADDTYRTW